MRENMGLYRGKRIDNGEWVEGYFFETNTPVYRAFIITNMSVDITDGCTDILDFDIVEVDPETVGQFTSKMLKYKEVFTGDIIRSYEDYDDKFGYPAVNVFTSVVIWDEDNSCFALNTDGYIQPFSEWDWNTSVIIGNIHDNPELLKGGEQNGTAQA